MNGPRALLVSSAVLAFACASHPGTTAPPPKPSASAATSAAVVPPGPDGPARALVAALARGDFAHPGVTFDDAMSAAMPEGKLRELFATLESSGGKFVGIDASTIQDKPPLRAVLLTLKFERLRRVMRVVLNEHDAVVGLFYAPVAGDLEAKTKALIEAAAKGDFDLASRDFDDTMKAALPPAKLGATWAAIEGKVGKLQAVESFEHVPSTTSWTTRATTRFERGTFVVEVSFESHDRMISLFVKAPPVAWAAPGYAAPDRFTEREVTVGASPALPGTLTLPKVTTKVPAVVLVHGSGPNDRDESIGGSKVFKDLAWGLASKGIAVLRYEKRTKVAPAGVVTQKDEVELAAHDAIELLRRTPEIDPKKIILIGHSQGGYLAPRIAQANAAALAGVVFLAGSTATLQDSILRQFGYFRTLNPKEPALATMVDAAFAFKKKVEDPKLGPDEDVALPTGGTAKGAYFLDVRGYDPAAVADKLTMPLFFLQGERDYQVTPDGDFAGWKKKLGGKKTVTLKTYPGLNHLFVTGSGTPSPAEYEAPGHVDEAVIRDIAAWISAR